MRTDLFVSPGLRFHEGGTVISAVQDGEARCEVRLGNLQRGGWKVTLSCS